MLVKKSSENFVYKANCNYSPDVTFLFFSFSLNDAIDFLMNTEDNSVIESSSDEDDHDLAMLPPIEKANNAETDIDSEVQGIIQKKSASGSRMLPLVIFDKKMPFFQKWC